MAWGDEFAVLPLVFVDSAGESNDQPSTAPKLQPADSLGCNCVFFFYAYL